MVTYKKVKKKKNANHISILRPVSVKGNNFPLSIFLDLIKGTEKHDFLLFMSNTLIEFIFLNKQPHIS